MQKDEYSMTDKLAIMGALFPESITEETRKMCRLMYERYGRDYPELARMIASGKPNCEARWAFDASSRRAPEWLGVMVEGKSFPVLSVTNSNAGYQHHIVKDGSYAIAEDEAGFTGLTDLRKH